MLISKGCERCGGDIYQDEDIFGGIDWRCFQCGRAPTPERLAKLLNKGVAMDKPLSEMNLHEKGAYFDEHGEEILADVNRYGLDVTLNKWRLSLGGWYHLRKRLQSKGYDIPKRKGGRPSKLKVKSGTSSKTIVAEADFDTPDFWRGYRQAVLDIFGSKAQQ